jgi:hypothetical protein
MLRVCDGAVSGLVQVVLAINCRGLIIIDPNTKE